MSDSSQPIYRTVAVDPIEDFLAYCEIMPEFDVSHPEEYALLEVAKATLANRNLLTGERLPVPPTKAEAALRELVNHPLLLSLFGAIEDSGTPEAAKLFGLVKAWVELRDETLAELETANA